MREPTIAKNYAEALIELARKAGGVPGGRGPNELEKWGGLIDEVANAMQTDRTLYVFLESPRVAASEKNRVLALALQTQVPLGFLRFLQALVKNRRQMVIPEIAIQYHALVDSHENRVHASVTVAREGDAAEKKLIADRLSKVVGKEVVPHFFVNPSILGGIIVRVGDTVMDGSVRRRLATLKGRMLGRA
jgi:F-type H+-transporting ATPase subunit delta